MITVASPSKPFEYTAKNDPRRLAIIKQYDEEINVLYEAVEESAQSDLAAPASWSYEDTMNFVRSVVSRVLEHPLADGEDLFHSGCDRWAKVDALDSDTRSHSVAQFASHLDTQLHSPRASSNHKIEH